MESVAIKGTPRKDLGKKFTKAVRSAGQVPCVIYGGENNIHFSAEVMAFRSLIYTPDFKLAEVEVDGKTYRCILKDIQMHPVTDDLVHLDFLELVPGKTIKLEIPVGAQGIAPGVKQGGKMFQKLRRVKVKTTPESLVEKLMVDVTGVDLGQSVRVRDIEVTEGIEMLSSPGIPVFSVEVPRALRSAAAAADAEAAVAEAEATTEE